MDNAAASITPTLLPVINFSLQQNRIPFLREVIVTNHTDAPLLGLTLTVSCEPAFFETLTVPIDRISAGSDFALRELSPILHAEMLLGLTETLTGSITLRLEKDGEVLASHTKPLSALAFDEWHGSSAMPELLCAFSMPNHPALAGILSRAAELLGEWTGSPALNAYQSKDPNRVLAMAAAVYGALQEQNITYAVSPAHFSDVGQRIRLCDTVLQQKLANCLDLTMLYTACLEAIGLHPLICLTEQHAFAGVWTVEHTFPETVGCDASLISKRLADGVTEISVVECTSLTAGRDVSFDKAMEAAAKTVNDGSFELVIDVKRARLSGIRPLPLRVLDGGSYVIEKEKRSASRLTAEPEKLGELVHVREGFGEGDPRSRLAGWERKLLDLGLRNSLINLRTTKGLIPLLSASLSELEDGLSDGGDYGISPCPAEIELNADIPVFEQCADLGERAALIREECKNKRLRAAMGEKELARSVVELYRSAKTSIEENGANTLFLALGLLRWYETKSSKKPRYAPLILLPVDIVRKSALKGYVIRLRDEEPQFNITLLEMLRQDFGIDITGLDTLSRDEHGLAVRDIIAVIRRAVMEQSRWDVLESAHLGIFSFSQFVMWNDLTNRLDDIKKNKIVASLMENRLTWDAVPMEIGSKVPEDGVFLPMSADASQLFAIEAAAEGKSFVLHGPPGTGKSQTITVLIANALAAGKTILFVAEKLAALQVVEKRLNSLGIGAFCLEIHSNKSRKRDVLEQLRLASEAASKESDGSFARRAEAAAQRRRELDAYAEALHRELVCGETLYGLISRYLDCDDDIVTVKLGKEFAAMCDAAMSEEIRALIPTLTAAAQEIGHPAGHPLSPIRAVDYTSTLRDDAPAVIDSYAEALHAFRDAADAFFAQTGAASPASFEDWERMAEAAKLIRFWRTVPDAWAKADNLPSLLHKIRELCALHSRIDTLETEITALFRDTVYSLDAADLQAKWNEAAAKWALPRMLAQNKIRKMLAAHAKAKNAVTNDAVPELLDKLCRHRTNSDEAKEQLRTLADSLGSLYVTDRTDWTRISALTDAADKNAAAMESLDASDMRRGGVSEAAASAADRFLQAFDAVCAAKEKAYMTLTLVTEPASDWIAGEIAMCADIARGLGGLKSFVAWNRQRARAVSMGLAPVIAAYEGGLAHEQVEPMTRKSVYESLITSAIDADPALAGFSGAMFNETVAQFARLDEELRELAKTEIYCRIASRIPNFSKEASQSSEVGILQRAIRSGGRGVSLRRLFEQIPNLLPRLCPCMLMSPMSAAQYLEPGRKPFDLVVFDEASQLPTCKAVGVIARADNAVIVGDPKQMPPTSFFASSDGDEESAEGDLESILDDCLALGMPQTHLTWHYRSRHESLIAFSNSRFYENRLYTFPAAGSRGSKVTMVKVDGVFDRGKTRTNRAEAEAIVAELKRRAGDPALANYSVGIVTFNISQQSLIEDLLEAECAKDPALEAWAYSGEEPVFVKNLENVQGDERDVILFSVAFAPDAAGVFYMNFGPLNRDGGWRRLNVAVTRSKHEMMVFSSIQPEQIDLSRTASEGASALRAFLEYASGRRLAETASTAGEASDAGIVQAICDALEAAGCRTEKNIGHSAYRIDIGILDPRDENRYLMGIMLDGASYAAAKTTRDREVAQISVLEGLGWRIRRVWSLDWLENPARETAKLLGAIENALAEKEEPVQPKAAEVPAADTSAAEISAAEAADSSASNLVLQSTSVKVTEGKVLQGFAEMPQTDDAGAELYKAAKLTRCAMTSEDFLLPKNEKRILKMIDEIIETEAPIARTLLSRRIMQACGISRAGSRVSEKLDTLLEQRGLQFTLQANERIYWAADADPGSYAGFRASGDDENKRDAEFVPVEEFANAAVAVLEEQIGLPRGDLVREAAKLLGYTRAGSVVTASAESGIAFARICGRIRIDDNGYCTLK